MAKVKVDYAAIKDFTSEEITAKLSAGEIDMPSRRSKEFKNWESFVNHAPGSPERTEFLASLAPPPEPTPSEGGTPPPPLATEEPEPTPSVDPAPPALADPPPAAELSDGDPWWKALGYEDESKVAESHTVLLDNIGKMQQRLDQFNADRGKVGRDKKEMEKQRDELVTRIGELEKAVLEAAPPAAEPPAMPEMPNPESFEDGVIDPKYVEAMKGYGSEVATYHQAVLDYNKSFKPDWAVAMERRLGEVSSQSEQTASYAQTSAETTAQEQSKQAWAKLWDTDIPAFQKEFQLPTTVAIKAISDSHRVYNDPKATPADRAAASQFIKNLPPTDNANYKKIQRAVAARFSFDTGVPVASFKAWQSAFIEGGLDKEYNAVTPVAPSQQDEAVARGELYKQENGSVSPIPSAQHGNADPKLSDQQTEEAERQEFMGLMNKWKAAMDSGIATRTEFEKGKEFTRYKTLLFKFGGANALRKKIYSA